jgi:thrombospondin 2/3/4/5
MKKVNELSDLVRDLSKSITTQNTEIKNIQMYMESCLSCQVEVSCRNSNPCFEGVECHDTASGMVCGNCPRGFVGDGKSCRRVEMCNDNPCFEGVECTDSDHGAICGSCPKFHAGDGRICNLRRNFCLDNPCRNGETCEQTDESPFYECKACQWGFTSHDGFQCVDIDECNIYRPCDDRVRCTNLSPGYSCESCPSGFTSLRSGRHVNGVRMEYFDDRANQRQICADVDECLEGIARCGRNMNCVNYEGSYECICATGFTQSNSSMECIPIPGICPDGKTVCDRNANCRFLGSSYDCKCKVGFAGDGFKCGSDRDLDGFPDRELDCSSKFCRQDNCIVVPVRL